MDVDIGLSSTQYFLAIVVFQVGYVIAEVPSKYFPIQIHVGLRLQRKACYFRGLDRRCMFPSSCFYGAR